MRKAMFFSVVLALTLAPAAIADGADSLNAGAWEFGGSFFYTFMPNYPVFASGLTDDDTGDYYQFLDVSASAGVFLADGFSLSVRPAMWLMARHSVNAIGQESTGYNLALELGLEPRYYLPIGPNMTLAFAAELGIGMMPGLAYLEDDVETTDKSLVMLFSLEPKLAYYYHVNATVAPFAELGYQLVYYREIKNSGGVDVVYPDGYSLFDDLYGRLHVVIGLKFFLPAGMRFGESRERSFSEWWDIGAK